MEPILFLVHRIPFPPNKGDKIRSFHLLRHLAERYRVHLGTFVDMPEDLAHVPELERAVRLRIGSRLLDPRTARLRSMSGFLTGEALTLPYYRNAALQAWVRETVVTARHSQGGRLLGCDGPVRPRSPGSAASCSTSSMSTLPSGRSMPSGTDGLRRWCIGGRVESYCPSSGPLQQSTAASVFVTPGEAELFLRCAPDCGSSVHVIENGVRTDYFSPPDPSLPSPYAADEVPVGLHRSDGLLAQYRCCVMVCARGAADSACDLSRSAFHTSV